MPRFDQIIDSVGDGSGITNMAGAADDYFIRPGADEFISISRILLCMEDEGRFSGGGYSGAGPLANGIEITLESPIGVLHTYTSKPIQKLGHWGLLAGVDMVMSNFTPSNDIVLVRWSLSKADHMTTLDGRHGEFLRVSINDSLADLVEHYMTAQGVLDWVGH